MDILKKIFKTLKKLLAKRIKICYYKKVIIKIKF